MAISLIGVGANLGDRADTLRLAMTMLGQHAKTSALVASAWHENRAIGGPPGQEPFLNGAIRLETTLGPEPLAHWLGEIETALGRRRGQRWQARPLDLDLLLYDDVSLSTPELTIPHPRMAVRRFVLAPASEVAPELIHPRIGWSVARLFEHLQTARPYVAIAGAPGVGKTALARRLAGLAGGSFLADPHFKSRSLDDPPSRSRQREIEFLRGRAVALEPVRHAARDETFVSDFWLEQSLAYAALELTEDELLEIETCYQKCCRQALPPKLLVVLTGEARGANPDDKVLPYQAGVAAALVARADRPGVGPTLFLDALEPAQVWAELTAALEAMR